MSLADVVDDLGSRVARRLRPHQPPALGRRAVPLRTGAGLVSFTFDGFTSGSARVGAQVLEDASVRGTFYTAPAAWGSVREDRAYAGLDDVDALYRQGHEIGLCPSPAAEAPSDRRSSRQHVASVEASAALFERGETDRRFSSFAYLGGPVHPRAKRDFGRRFASCRSREPGLNAGRMDTSSLRSVSLADAFGQEGATHWLERTQECGAWLLFTMDDVHEEPRGAGTSRALLAHAVGEARRLQLEVLPVRHALARAAFG